MRVQKKWPKSLTFYETKFSQLVFFKEFFTQELQPSIKSKYFPFIEMKSKESYYKVHMRINFFFLFLKLEQEVIEYDNVKQFKVFLKTLYEE